MDSRFRGNDNALLYRFPIKLGMTESNFARQNMHPNREYYVYILASQKNGTLYVGVTNNLETRIYQHKNKLIKGFTSIYNVDKLVYYETYNDIYEAIVREKRIKKWERKWKIRLIEKNNSEWQDLYRFPPSRE